MRLLFAIVHYYKSGDGRHGSLAADPRPRIDALRRLILQLHRLFGQPAGSLNHLQRRVDGVTDGGGPVDLRVCVSGHSHLLDRLSGCEGLYRQEACYPEDPRLLGFEAQRVLLEAWHAAEIAGEPFDYIAYLEDDILLTDADFFLKLRCFNKAFGDNYLVMPNRIETMERMGSCGASTSMATTIRLLPMPTDGACISGFASPISAKWFVSSSPQISIPALFSLIVSKRVSMPVVTMQQRSIPVFTDP